MHVDGHSFDVKQVNQIPFKFKLEKQTESTYIHHAHLYMNDSGGAKLPHIYFNEHPFSVKRNASHSASKLDSNRKHMRSTSTLSEKPIVAWNCSTPLVQWCSHTVHLRQIVADTDCMSWSHPRWSRARNDFIFCLRPAQFSREEQPNSPFFFLKWNQQSIISHAHLLYLLWS